MTEQLSKLVPVFVLLAVLIIAAALGAAWNAGTVQITNTGLWQLEPSYQGIYVQAVADAYALDRNTATAAQRLSFLCQQDGGINRAFEQAAAFYGADPTKADNLSQLRRLLDEGRVQQNADVQVCNFRPIDATAGLMRILAPLLLVLMGVGIVGYGVLQVIRSSEEDALIPGRLRGITAPPEAAKEEKPQPTPAAAPPAATDVAAPPAGAEEPAPPVERSRAGRTGLGISLPFGRKPEEEETLRSPAARGAAISAQVEKTDYEELGYETPIVQFMTTYLHGDELYDDSFSIEAASGEFLGECGVGISETLAPDDGKLVTAFELWLFDKNDIRTVTKVLMSEYAYHDDAIRAKLAPKGEAVLAQPGARMTLETATLRVQARIVDLAYGTGPQPPNSYFSRVTIELAAWKRDDRSAGGGTPPPATGSRVPPQSLGRG
ncbi:MAG: hypothetical protein Kow00124_20960 [Anaerolineae bacterium]